MNIFDNQIDFLGKRKMFYVISATLFILSIVGIIIRGLQFGIDTLKVVLKLHYSLKNRYKLMK